MIKFTGVFKRNFISLFLAQLSGSFDDNMFRTAFVTFITYKIAGLSSGDISFFVAAALAAYMLPYLLFSILAGEFADKYSKTKVIKIVKFSEVITVLLIVLGFYLRSPFFLLFVLFVMGTQAAFFGPVKYSVLPQILKKQDLLAANGFMEAGRYIAILLGTIVGGVLIAADSLGFTAAGFIMLIVALAGFAATLFFKDLPSEAPGAKISPNIFKSIYRNINSVYKSKSVLLCILAISWFWVLGAVMLSQLPDLTSNVLNGSDKVFNYLLTLFAIGIGVGALGSVKLLKGDVSLKYIPFSAVVMSAALVDLAFAILTVNFGFEIVNFGAFISTFTGIRVSLDIFLISVCAGLYIVPLNATLQTMGSGARRSKIIAVSNFINTAAMVIASVISFILLYVGSGSAPIIGILAISNLVVAVYICRLLPDYVLRSALFFLLNFLYDIKINGLENYQKAGKRTLIIANNNSFLDPLLLAAFLPDDITFVVDSTIAKRFWVRIFLRFIKHFPVDPTNAIAVKTIIDEIKKGRRVVIYPEGRISTTGTLMKIYPGPAMIADKSDAEILPIFMHGTQYSRFAYFGRKLRHLPQHVQFTINILPSRKLNIPGNLKGKDRRYKAEDKVYDLMTEMKYKSSNKDATLFHSLLEAADLAGYGRRALEDVQRKGLSFFKVILGTFLLGNKFSQFTKNGEFTGLLLPNMNVCAISIFALMAYGRVPAMINFSSGIRNILSACRSAQLKSVITSKLFVQKAELQPVIDELKKAGISIVYLEDIQKTIKTGDKLRALRQALFPYKAAIEVNPKADPKSPAVVLFTSGSEGVPKGVVLSHRNINANRYQLSSIIDYGLQDKFFNALPMFHSFGLVCGLFMPILSGAGVFLYPSPLHYKIIPELIYDRNATVIFGTDTFLNAYAKAAHPYDFYSIRLAAIGAEKLKDETFKLWSEKFGIRVLEAYGATETAPGISFTTPMHFKRGTVGRIFPDLDFKIEPVPGIEGAGKLVVKGDNVMLGYITEAAPGVITPPEGGWYDTGDIVSMDEDGFITIVGRAKRFAKIAGEMVSLSAVETGLAQVWPEHKHAVIRLPDEKRGEQLFLYTTNPTADLKVVQESFRRLGYSDLWVPKKLMILEDLPVMGSGKTDYVKLEELAASKRIA